MKKVVLIVPAFPKLSEAFIVSKFLGLLEKGWDVHVVCGRSPAAAWRRFPELERRSDARRRVHVVWPVRPAWRAGLLLPFAAGWGLSRQPRSAWRYLRRGWRRFGVDVVRRWYLDAPLLVLRPDLVHFEFGTLAVGRLYLKALLDCRVIVSFRGYDANYVGLEDPTYYEEVWRGADALHLLGEDLWQRVLRRGCPVDKPHTLIPPAIDVQFFDPGEQGRQTLAGREGRPLRILSVGRLAWKKGYAYALQAVRRLSDLGVACDYTIVGDGAHYDAVAFARHDLELTDRVHLVGAQSREEVKAHLSQSDVFLHAAVSEGFCNAVLEAQAMQVPVVCTDADGLSENVVHGQTGFVVPRRDSRALSEKLAVLANDPALRRQMGQAGRRHVLDHFRLTRQIDQFDALYRGVLTMPARTPGQRVA